MIRRYTHGHPPMNKQGLMNMWDWVLAHIYHQYELARRFVGLIPTWNLQTMFPGVPVSDGSRKRSNQPLSLFFEGNGSISTARPHLQAPFLRRTRARAGVRQPLKA